MNKAYAAAQLAGLAGGGNVVTDEPMKYHTSFKVGGPADIIVAPENADSLIKVYQTCIREEYPVFVMGNGTNLIVRDKGIRGVVIKIFDNLSRYEVLDDVIVAEAGILMSRLSRIALEQGLSGLEFAEGIPGTLGGAVAMNAGAYGGEMSDIVFRTEYLDRQGRQVALEKDAHLFGKRSSFIQTDGGIALKIHLKLKKGDRSAIKGLMDDFNRQRREKQPLELPSAGSIFKRPEGYFAGKLVQDCGLRGFGIGGAEVSRKHCGFIVNTGNATADDIIKLISHIRSAVMQKFHVELQTEVRTVGEE